VLSLYSHDFSARFDGYPSDKAYVDLGQYFSLDNLGRNAQRKEGKVWNQWLPFLIRHNFLKNH